MNRKDRRTRGKFIMGRLQELRNSKVLQTLDFKDIPQDVMDSLIANTCENIVLQKRYNLQKRLIQEAIDLEIELHNLKVDLASKRGSDAS